MTTIQGMPDWITNPHLTMRPLDADLANPPPGLRVTDIGPGCVDAWKALPGSKTKEITFACAQWLSAPPPAIYGACSQQLSPPNDTCAAFRFRSPLDLWARDHPEQFLELENQGVRMPDAVLLPSGCVNEEVIESFYGDLKCGGVVLTLDGDARRETELKEAIAAQEADDLGISVTDDVEIDPVTGEEIVPTPAPTADPLAPPPDPLTAASRTYEVTGEYDDYSISAGCCDANRCNYQDRDAEFVELDLKRCPATETSRLKSAINGDPVAVAAGCFPTVFLPPSPEEPTPASTRPSPTPEPTSESAPEPVLEPTGESTSELTADPSIDGENTTKPTTVTATVGEETGTVEATTETSSEEGVTAESTTEASEETTESTTKATDAENMTAEGTTDPPFIDPLADVPRAPAGLQPTPTRSCVAWIVAAEIDNQVCGYAGDACAALRYSYPAADPITAEGDDLFVNRLTLYSGCTLGRLCPAIGLPLSYRPNGLSQAEVQTLVLGGFKWSAWEGGVWDTDGIAEPVPVLSDEDITGYALRIVVTFDDVGLTSSTFVLDDLQAWVAKTILEIPACIEDEAGAACVENVENVEVTLPLGLPEAAAAGNTVSDGAVTIVYTTTSEELATLAGVQATAVIEGDGFVEDLAILGLVVTGDFVLTAPVIETQYRVVEVTRNVNLDLPVKVSRDGVTSGPIEYGCCPIGQKCFPEPEGTTATTDGVVEARAAVALSALTALALISGG